MLVEPVAASLVFVESVFLFEVEENLKDGEQEAVASLLAVTGIEEVGLGDIIELVEQNEVLEPDLLDTTKPCPDLDVAVFFSILIRSAPKRIFVCPAETGFIMRNIFGGLWENKLDSPFLVACCFV